LHHDVMEPFCYPSYGLTSQCFTDFVSQQNPTTSGCQPTILQGVTG
jgi:hypothetical protein